MIKRLSIIILVSFCLALYGCTHGETAETTENKDAVSENETHLTPDESFTADESLTFSGWTRPVIDGVTDDWPIVPEYTGKPLIAPDPDRSAYFTLANQDCDFYPNGQCRNVGFFILTKEPFGKENIKVRIPIETGYEVSVDDWSKYCHSLEYDGYTHTVYGLDSYQYLSLQGIDWRGFSQLYHDCYNAYNLADAVENTDPALYEQLQRLYIEPFHELHDAYKAAYESCSEDDIPLFYIYSIEIYLTDLCNEKTNTVEVDLGDETYILDIGEWRFHSELPEQFDVYSDPTGIRRINMQTLSFDGDADWEGYALIRDAVWFRTTKDISLTALTAEEIESELIGCRVKYLDPQENPTMDFYWDGKTPLDIPANTNVAINVYFFDERFTSYEVTLTTMLKLDYDVDDTHKSFTTPAFMHRQNNIWDTYLMAFHGYDIGEYYTCYYNFGSSSSWWEVMPEAWRR